MKWNSPFYSLKKVFRRMYSFGNVILINLLRTEIQYMLKEAYILEQEKDDSANDTEIPFRSHS